MGLSAGAQCKRASESKFGHAFDVECSCPSKRRCQLHSVSAALPQGKIVLSETIICASIVDVARRNGDGLRVFGCRRLRSHFFRNAKSLLIQRAA